MRKRSPHNSEAAAEELKQLVYRVSHDFSAPLRAVVEFSRLLKDEHAGQLDAEGQLYLSMVMQAGEKMQGMLEGLLAISRLNTTPLKLETIESSRILEQSQLSLKETVQSNKAVIKVDQLPRFTVDPQHLGTLFAILLDNAVKFSKPDSTPHIRVSAERDGKFWQFSVVDDGIGIAEEFHEDIFTIFRKLHADSRYPGLGIGLAIAAKIVSLYGGRIWVESAEGKGAAFRFTLPAD